MTSTNSLSDATLREFRSALRALVRRIGRQLRDETECCGMGFQRCLVLLALDETPGCSLRTLEVTLGTDKATLSRVVDSLVQHGLVSRIQNPADRRTILLHLTPAGRRQAEAINRYCNEKYRRILRHIPSSEHAVVVRVIGQLAKAFAEFGSEAIPGLAERRAK